MKRKTSGKATKRAGHKKVATGYKVSDLAKALGITSKTIYHLRAKHKGPLSTDPAEWAEYLERRALETGVSQSIALGPKDYQKLRLKLLRAQVGKEEAIRKLKELELERQSQNLVPMAEAKEAIRKVLVPLRELLEGMPKAFAIQANPTDPQMAEQAAKEALDNVFGMIQKNVK
jgi:hypothetical protein|tara:strand:+ start:97 stop:618 length:522 start_codon:yes stop_codon:yes gene_type:complete